MACGHDAADPSALLTYSVLNILIHSVLPLPISGVFWVAAVVLYDVVFGFMLALVTSALKQLACRLAQLATPCAYALRSQVAPAPTAERAANKAAAARIFRLQPGIFYWLYLMPICDAYTAFIQRFPHTKCLYSGRMRT